MRYVTVTRIGVVCAWLILILDTFGEGHQVGVIEDTLTFLTISLLATVLVREVNSVQWSLRKLWLNRSSLISSLSSVIGLLFLVLWVMRWQKSSLGEYAPSGDFRYRTFLQAGAILAFFYFIFQSGTFRRKWAKIELNPARKILISYLLLSVVATASLIMPWSLKPGVAIQLVDAFFVSVSALSVTGLSPLNIANTFSTAGQWTLLILIQLGGLGIVALSVGLAMMTRQRLSLSNSLIGKELFDIPNIGDMSEFIKRVILFALGLEGLGAILIYFALPAEIPSRGFHSIFHAVSAFCNAGFSSFEFGLEPQGLGAVRSILMVLIVLGGMGFPVLFEVIQFLGKKCKPVQLSSHVILSCLSGAVLLVVGTLGIWMIEGISFGGQLSGWESFGDSLFYSISSRTAGFNVNPWLSLRSATHLFLIPLMVIGGAPLSTAGGIKTTTAAVMMIATTCFLQGKQSIQFGNREIAPYVLQKAIALVVVYLLTTLGAVIVLSAIESIDLFSLTFEVVSALSTVGLSLDVTSRLSVLGKLMVAGLMMAGRLGLITMVYVGIGKVVNQKYRYPNGHFYVG